MSAYDSVAEGYAAEVRAGHDSDLRDACRSRFLSRAPPGSILEVGAGPAEDSRSFRRRGRSVIASDLSFSMLAQARRRSPALPLTVSDVVRLPFAAGSFSGIYGFACFQHVPRGLARTALGELRRVLRPDGVLFLLLIRSELVDEYVVEDWGGVPGNALRFLCWRPEELAELTARSGFHEVECFDTPAPHYEELPRLKSRGVRLFGMLATARRLV